MLLEKEIECHRIVQLQTTKVDKLNISGTRFFGENLTADLKPDRLKELKNDVFMLYPCIFGHAKILSKNFGPYQVYRWLNLGTWASANPATNQQLRSLGS